MVIRAISGFWRRLCAFGFDCLLLFILAYFPAGLMFKASEPRPGEEVKTSTFVQTVGGGAVITAVAAARLGLQCRVITGVGGAAMARLRQEHVPVTNLKRPDEPHAITASLSTRVNRSFVTFNGINDVLEPRLQACYELLARTMRNLGTPVYPLAYLRQLTSRDPQRWFVFAVFDREHIVAAVWTAAHGATLHPHFVGYDRDSYRVGVSNFLYWGCAPDGAEPAGRPAAQARKTSGRRNSIHPRGTPVEGSTPDVRDSIIPRWKRKGLP